MSMPMVQCDKSVPVSACSVRWGRRASRNHGKPMAGVPPHGTWYACPAVPPHTCPGHHEGTQRRHRTAVQVPNSAVIDQSMKLETPLRAIRRQFVSAAAASRLSSPGRALSGRLGRNGLSRSSDHGLWAAKPTSRCGALCSASAKQPGPMVVVANKPGASGAQGVRAMDSAKSDGYWRSDLHDRHRRVQPSSRRAGSVEFNKPCKQQLRRSLDALQRVAWMSRLPSLICSRAARSRSSIGYTN
jgi:hypothetical protein